MLTQKSIKLSEVNFLEFLYEGFIIQKPGTDIIYLGYGSEVSTGAKFHIAPFYGNSPKQIVPNFLVKTNTSEFERFLKLHLKQKVELEHVKSFDDLFLEDIKFFLDNLNSNSDIQKLVAVTRDLYQIKNNIHPVNALKKLDHFHSASVYGYWCDSQGILGFSPEPLLEKLDDCWQTRALAGTIKTSAESYREVLLNDPKEKVEHEWVITDIKIKLQDIGTLLNIGRTQVVDFGSIAHLQTLIHFEKKRDIDFQSMIEAFSPTAALGGYPSQLSSDYLKKTQYYKFDQMGRQFGGVIALESEDDTFALVCIRNIQWQDSNLIVDSGCGVVSQSIPEKELIEVQNKRRSIMEALF